MSDPVTSASTRTAAISYAAAFAIFGGVDFVWLSLVGGPLFERDMGSQVEIRPLAAIAFYLVYPVGLLVFAVLPSIRLLSLRSAAAYGAAFGFFAYATYDLTNYATLRGYTLKFAKIDMAWGTILSAITAGGAYAVARPR